MRTVQENNINSFIVPIHEAMAVNDETGKWEWEEDDDTCYCISTQEYNKWLEKLSSYVYPTHTDKPVTKEEPAKDFTGPYLKAYKDARTSKILYSNNGTHFLMFVYAPYNTTGGHEWVIREDTSNEYPRQMRTESTTFGSFCRKLVYSHAPIYEKIRTDYSIALKEFIEKYKNHMP